MGDTLFPKSRAEAKAFGAAYYFTGTPCKHGHIAPRKTKGACLVCMESEWKGALEKRKPYFQEYNKSEAGKRAKQRYYKENREAVIVRAASRPESIKNKYRKIWRDANPAYRAADARCRRTKHKHATPKWLTREQRTEMRGIYQAAMALTKATGVPHVVDHIVPLRSNVVCGLHVPWNLRVISRADNLKKSNKLEE